MDASLIVCIREFVMSLATDLRALASRAEGISCLLPGIEDDPGRQPRRAGAPPGLIDEPTFSVHWNGKVCYLGYTVTYRLLDCLARHANEFVAHEQLLEDVWDGERSSSAIRSAVSDLRSRLSRAGMKELSKAIDGRNPGYYGLFLRRPRAAKRAD